MADSLSDKALQERTPDGVPAPPLDDDNAALIDAAKTFNITLISAILFCAAAIFLVLRTRGG